MINRISIFSVFNNSTKTQIFYIDQEKKKLETRGYFLHSLINYKDRVRNINIKEIVPNSKTKEHFIEQVWNDFLQIFEHEYEIIGGIKMEDKKINTQDKNMKEIDAYFDTLIDNNKEHWLSELDNIDEEIWHPDFEADSRGEVIEITKEYIKEINPDCDKFRIGRRVKIDFPTVDAELIIEELKNIADDNVGELAETFLESTTVEQDEELTNDINEVIRKWVDKHNLDPEYYMVLDEEIIEVNENEKNNK